MYAFLLLELMFYCRTLYLCFVFLSKNSQERKTNVSFTHYSIINKIMCIFRLIPIDAAFSCDWIHVVIPYQMAATPCSTLIIVFVFFYIRKRKKIHQCLLNV